MFRRSGRRGRQRPVIVREEDSMSGGVIYQVDVFRQAKAPILKTAGALNMGAYQLTAVIA